MKSWLIVRVAETFFPVFGLDDSAIRMVALCLAIGFVPAIVLSWWFDLTPRDLICEEEIVRESPDVRRRSRGLERLIIVGLLVALGYFAIDKFVISHHREAARQVEQVCESQVPDIQLVPVTILIGRALVFNELGQEADFQGELSRLIELSGEEYGSEVALVQAWAGNLDEAFHWLEKERESGAGSGWTQTLGYPHVKNLAADPRWLPFLRSVGAAPEQLAAIEFNVPPLP